MQIVTTHKNADFDAFASVVAATLLFPEALAVLPKTLNPNV
jgi:nanoRNase/pAp phosphatase (c-di-AMP/oligoRNAs hydrolase)